MFAKLSRELLSDLGLFMIRSIVGVDFLFHGLQKMTGIWGGSGLPGFAAYLEQLSVPYPAYGAVAASAAELLGGVALITGFGMRIAALPLMATMGVAIYFVHRTQFAAQAGGMEFPLTLGLATLGLTLTGPGSLAVRTIPGLRLLESLVVSAPRRLDIRESITDTITESVRQSPQYASLMRQRVEG